MENLKEFYFIKNGLNTTCCLILRLGKNAPGNTCLSNRFEFNPRIFRFACLIIFSKIYYDIRLNIN